MLSAYIRRILLVIVALWTVSLLIIRFQWGSETTINALLEEKLNGLSRDISSLHTENEEMKKILNKLGIEMKERTGPLQLPEVKLSSLSKDGPSSDQEYLRRRVENEARELWRFVGTELNHLIGLKGVDGAGVQERLQEFLHRAQEEHTILLANTERLADEGGLKEWRQKELDALAKEVQQRLKELQNPSDCATARKAFCDLRKGCGFGCLVHHLLYCLTITYATGRTMILDPMVYRYGATKWDDYFQMPNKPCPNLRVPSGYSFNLNSEGDFSIPIIDSISEPRPFFLPQAVPADIADRLSRLHGAPFVWFAGQLLSYLMRPLPKFRQELETRIKTLTRGNATRHPIVGVHVRRTDKLAAEAKFHDLSEYMVFVEDWFQREEFRRLPLHPNTGDEPQKLPRRIYLATDEPQVLQEAKLKYPGYEFISDMQLSLAGGLSQRYTNDGFRSIILDSVMLANTDYLVCTFSSQVCRIAYELMQTRHHDLGDASNRFSSLDDIYYFGGQNPNEARVIYPHHMGKSWSFASHEFQEVNLKTGEVIKIGGNHWNGFTVGSLRGAMAKFPSYKIEYMLRTAALGNLSSVVMHK